MFDKFGEFDSYEEINRAAEAQLKEGDTEAIYKIAEENGLDKEDAEDFIDGCVYELATPLMAAVGKIKVESEELQLKGIVADWRDVILEMCANDQNMAVAVRKKAKQLKECMASLIEFSFDNKVQVSNKIIDICMVNHNGKREKFRGPLYLGFPSKSEAKKLISEYYLK